MPYHTNRYLAGPQVSLNYSDLDCLSTNEPLLTTEQVQMLKLTRLRIDKYPQRFARTRDQYSSMAGIILMSTWARQKSFCGCSIGNRPCKQVKFCAYCCHLRRMEMFYRYLTSFKKSSWYFITVSFNGSISFDEFDGGQTRFHWDAIGAAMKQMVRSGLIEGALWTEELHIESLVPLRVLPHCHALVTTDTFGEQQTVDLEELVTSFTPELVSLEAEIGTKCLEQMLKLQADVKVSPVFIQRDFANRLAYLFKPIDLVTPYRDAWRNGVACQGGDASELNSNVDMLFSGLELFIHSRRQVRTIGNLHAKCSSYLGIKKSQRERKTHQNRIRELLVECNAEPFPSDEPL